MANYSKVPGLRRGTRIEVKYKNNIPQVLQQIRKLDVNYTMGLEMFANNIANYIKEIIKTEKKSNPNKPYDDTIENTIEVESNSQKNAFYILNTNKLDEAVPYWRLINNGGFIPPHFVPGGFTDGPANSNKTGGNFIYSPYSGMGMKIKSGTVIAGMHFVERGQSYVNREFIPFMTKFTRTYI
jgi:hypothetical protein